MMDGRDRPSRPALQFAGKSLTWRDRNLRPLNGFSRQPAPQLGIEPDAIFVARAEIFVVIGRGVNRISRKQNLWHRRASEREVSRRKQHLGSAIRDYAGKVPLFVPEAVNRRAFQLYEIDVVEVRELLSQPSAGCDCDSQAWPTCQLRQNISNVG